MKQLLSLLCLSFISLVIFSFSNSRAQNYSKQTPLEESIKRGAEVYQGFCMRCHLPNGNGVASVYPPVANSNWLTEKREESIHAVKYGLKGEIEVNGETYNNLMSPMGLSDKEVADVMNYIMNNFKNTQKTPVTPKEVAKIKK